MNGRLYMISWCMCVCVYVKRMWSKLYCMTVFYLLDTDKWTTKDVSSPDLTIVKERITTAWKPFIKIKTCQTAETVHRFSISVDNSVSVRTTHWLHHNTRTLSVWLTFSTRIPVTAGAPEPLRLPRPAPWSCPAGCTIVSGCLSMQAPASPPFWMPVWVLVAAAAVWLSSSSIAMSQPCYQRHKHISVVLLRDWQIPTEKWKSIPRCDAMSRQN